MTDHAKQALRCMSAALISTIVVSVVPVSLALFMAPSPAPIDRLLQNTQRYIQQHSNDPSGHYILARLHYLAFIGETQLAQAYSGDRELPAVAPFFEDPEHNKPHTERVEEAAARHVRYEAEHRALAEMGYQSHRELVIDQRKRFDNVSGDQSEQRAAFKIISDENQLEKQRLWDRIRHIEAELQAAQWLPPALDQEQVNDHILASFYAFERTLELDKAHALALLGSASLLEQYAEYLEETNAEPIEELKPIGLQAIMARYYQAHKAGYAQDKQLEHRPLRGFHTLVSVEAGQAYLRHYEQHSASASILQEFRARQVKSNLKKITSKPPSGIVTPIIFSLDEKRTFDDLLDTDIQVNFDLSGLDPQQTWPWIKPSTFLLVYDPEGTGKITSGRQLFGSYSFAIPFDDGYQALSTLDDNGDGRISGDELKGISAWRDINSNGVSEPGEVRPVGELGILSVLLDYDVSSATFLSHSTGLHLSDGSTRSTWDWFAKPIRGATEIAGSTQDSSM